MLIFSQWGGASRDAHRPRRPVYTVGAIMEGWASLSGLAEKHFEGGLDALEADLAAIAAEEMAFR